MSNAPAKGAISKDGLTNQFKVKLVQERTDALRNSRESNSANVNQKKGRWDSTRVVFDVTPDIMESREVKYKTLEPIHMPGQIFIYGGTNSRIFSLSNIKLISRTIAEATKNMNTLWTLRGWTMPYFGEGSSNLSNEERANRRDLRDGSLDSNQRADHKAGKLKLGKSLLGKPPEVLLLSAYSNTGELSSVNGRKNRQFATNLSNIPVVITSLNIPYPSDVDYIPDQNGQPVPRVRFINIQLQETHAPRDYTRQFSIQDFRKGILDRF
jgi:hypothetical protein